jgi:hypothetical protein
MTSTLTPPAATTSAVRRPLTPIQVWAGIGAVLIVLELSAVTAWVTGPNFQEIPVGPDQPPQWMRVTLDAIQIVGIVVAALLAWFLLIRPLIRERRLTLNGSFVIAGVLASFWDGLSAAPQMRVNYNSYLFNRGSVLSAVPGVLSPNADGVGQSWPFFAIPAYIILVPSLGALGAFVMRRTRRRFPALNAVGLIVVCVLVLMTMEFLMEAFLLSPLGIYSLEGAPGPALFGDTFHRMPLMEVVHGGMFFAVPGILKYFVNDNGETIAERGSQTIPGTRRLATMRAVAVIGAIHVGFLVTYHLPVMAYAVNSSEFPDDVKNRSYFLGNACGESLDIACPGPHTPVLRPGTGHFDWHGNYVPPAR